jgi:predicted metalloenzyme YecM
MRDAGSKTRYTKEMDTVEEFYAESGKLIGLFNAFAVKHSLAGRAQADHICYKCGSKESFEKVRKMFEDTSEYIYQAVISNRRIAIIRFKQGMETSLGVINFLELSDQKPDNSQHDGFDHIEAYAVGRSYEEMVKELEASEKVVKVERPHHTTHDIDMGGGLIFRCTQGPLIEKIKKTEML